jgi:D-hydroxyproline dehydrogenase subunit beta
MPDVIVVGGGIVGTTAAWQLAERGAEVLLLERGGLASGATARSQGLLLPPDHVELDPLFDESNRLYDKLAVVTGVDLALDAGPIGMLMLATNERQLETLRSAPRGNGDLLSAEEVHAEEPALTETVTGGLLVHAGRRSDPGALAAAAAMAAREAGATIRTHVDVKRLMPGAVVADDGLHKAATILLAAGAWSRTLARSAGHELPVRPVRGWLAIVAPGPQLLNHVVYEAEYDPAPHLEPGRPVTMSELAGGDLATIGAGGSHALGAHQNRDGTIMIGASRSAALRETDESAESLRASAERACRLIPSLAEREVATTWTGLRPFSADGLPYIGALDEGLIVCAGHGSEGILTGAGSGRLAAELAVGTATYTAAEPFSPGRISVPAG